MTNDLISRQAAIDAFDGVKVNEDDCTEYDIGYNDGIDFAVSKLSVLPSAQPEPIKVSVDREMTEEELKELKKKIADSPVVLLPSAQPDPEKYEYHYDHTDCIWYRPEAQNRCPVTCAQYRDGWNDAMNYIFRDGKGYMPYRRDEKYEG